MFAAERSEHRACLLLRASATRCSVLHQIQAALYGQSMVRTYVMGAVGMPVTVLLAERPKKYKPFRSSRIKIDALYARGGCNMSFQSLFTKVLVRSMPSLEVGCSPLASYQYFKISDSTWC